MKHTIKISIILLSMFFLTQIVGLVVANIYASAGDEIPFGMSPPEDITPTASLVSIIFAIAFAVLLILILMKFRTEFFLRAWFTIVVILAIGISVNAFLVNTNLSESALNLFFFKTNAASFIALLIALPLAYFKIFKRDIFVHNFTEVLIYPGIAVIFIPLLNIWTVIFLLILISIYDIYAVWHAGFMQKMAKYQIKNLKLFSGFLIPYLSKKERALVQQMRKMEKSGKKQKLKKIKVSLAVLGGGDVVFPIILAGVVLRALGIIPALITSIGATAALAFLLYFSKKGKFYPAMPFISAGCFIGFGLGYIYTIF